MTDVTEGPPAVRGSFTVAVTGAYETDIEAFVRDVGCHLRAAWRRNLPVLVRIRGDQPLVVDTLEDLEIIHTVAAIREDLE